MANRLAQEVEKILSAAVGDFIAKATVKKNCELIGTTPDALTADQLPALAHDPPEAGHEFFGEASEAGLRCFQIDAYQYDGVPVPRDGVWQFGDNNPDMALYDHVEIVRGATIEVSMLEATAEWMGHPMYIRHSRPTAVVAWRPSILATGLSYP